MSSEVLALNEALIGDGELFENALEQSRVRILNIFKLKKNLHC